ncbi:MAG TPA: V-type ATPase subunit, partial [Thermoplasmata archaeon]|nr:V-type ATPase subunit [Thermoplasmata archaeon]
IAINRLFVRRCRQTLDIAPFAGKPILAAYLRRWDIENISLILSAKAQGRLVSESEAFLVSSREIPAGLFAGAMTLDDFRGLLQEPTLEGMAQQLVRYGYGGVVLTRLDAYAQSKDIFPILQALDADYYARLNEAIRFFQGDEWNIRLFVQSEIDVRNALLLLKGKAAALDADIVLERFIDGGSLPRASAADAFGARDVPELVTALAPRFPALPDGLPPFQADGTLAGFESALVRERAIRELRRMRSYPLSLAVLFMFLLEAELERTDLRRIVYGHQYGVPPATLVEQLIVPKL